MGFTYAYPSQKWLQAFQKWMILHFTYIFHFITKLLSYINRNDICNTIHFPIANWLLWQHMRGCDVHHGVYSSHASWSPTHSPTNIDLLPDSEPRQQKTQWTQLTFHFYGNSLTWPLALKRRTLFWYQYRVVTTGTFRWAPNINIQGTTTAGHKIAQRINVPFSNKLIPLPQKCYLILFSILPNAYAYG